MKKNVKPSSLITPHNHFVLRKDHKYIVVWGTKGGKKYIPNTKINRDKINSLVGKGTYNREYQKQGYGIGKNINKKREKINSSPKVHLQVGARSPTDIKDILRCV